MREPERFVPIVERADLVLAADSGYDHLLRMGLRPRVLLGDLDSISAEAREDARCGGVEVETFPEEKDLTDLELTLTEALRRGASTVLGLGVFGERLDHTLANVLLLAAPAFRRHDVRLLDERQEVRLVRGHLQLRTDPGEIVSLLPVGGEVRGVTTSGLYYSLHDATLETGPALGISNVAVAEQIDVIAAEGLLLLTWLFRTGLDGERYLVENPPE